MKADLVTDAMNRMVLGQCYREATKSEDNSTQIGACIASPSGYVYGSTMAHNGFTKGWIATEYNLARPRKYSLIEHAERRAIYRAARNGIMLEGGTMYSTWAACADCARAIVEVGLARLVRHYPPVDDATERWLESVSLGDEIMRAGGVDIVDVIGPIPEGFKILRGGEIFDPAN